MTSVQFVRQGEFCMSELLRHIFMKHTKRSLRLAYGAGSDVTPVLEAISSLGPPDFWPRFMSKFGKKYHHLQWFAKAVQVRVDGSCESRALELPQEFYMKLLEEWEPVSYTIPATLESVRLGRPIRPTVATRFLSEISRISKIEDFRRKQGLFIALSPTISDVFKNIDPNFLMAPMKAEEVLHWFREIPKSLIRHVMPETDYSNEEMRAFAQAACLLKDDGAAQDIQMLLSFKQEGKEYIYRANIWPGTDEDHRKLLARSCLRNNEDFLRVAIAEFEYCEEHRGTKPQDGRRYGGFATRDDMYTLVLLLRHDQWKMDQFVENFLQSKNGLSDVPIVKELRKRMTNDQELLSWIITHTGKRHSLQDFESSIPKLFDSQLVTMGTKILDYVNSSDGLAKFYFCNDDEMRNDKLFICYFCILHTVMEVLMKQKDLDSAKIQITELMSHVLGILHKDQERLVQGLTLEWLKDMFSLIFLKGSDGKFLCWSAVAELILEQVIERVKQQFGSDYFDADLRRAFSVGRTYVMLLRKEGREICNQTKLDSLKTVINDLVLADKTESIDLTYLDDYKVRKFFSLLKDVKGKDSPSDQNLRGYWIEKFLSEGTESEYIDFETECGVRMKESSATPRRRRYQSRLEVVDLPEPNTAGSPLVGHGRTKSLDKFSLNDMEAEQWMMDIVKKHRSLKNCLWFYPKDKHCPFTTGFKDYQRMSELLKQNAHLQGQGDLINPIDIIDKIRECGEGMDMKTIETLLGPKAVELIVTYSKIFNNRLLDLISQKSELAGLAVMYQMAATKQKFVESEKRTIFRKFLKRKFGNQDEQSEYESVGVDPGSNLDHCDKQLTVLNDKEFTSIVEMALAQVPMKTRLLNDLYARNPELFTKLLLAKLSDIDVNDLLELDALMDKKSLPKLKTMGFVKLDLDEVVSRLIKQKQWQLLLTVTEDFISDTSSVKKKVIDMKNEIEKECPALLKKLKIHVIPMQTVVESTVSMAQFAEMLAPCKSLSLVLDALQKINFPLTIEMNNHLIDVMSKVLSSIKISTSGDEDYALYNLPKISKIVSRINTSSFTLKMDTLVSLLRLSLVSRFGITIELKGFTTEAFGREMARTALKYDYVQMMLDVCSAWSIDFVGFTLERSLFPFRMGLPDVGLSMLKGIPLGKREYMVPTFVNLLSHESLFDLSPAFAAETEMDTISALVSMEPLHKRWHDVMEKRFGVLMVSPAIKALHEILMMLNEKGYLISFYCLHMDFDDAIEVWNTVSNQSVKTDLFIKAIVYTAMAFWNWNTLWRKLLRDDSSLSQFKEAVIGLFKFLKQNGMGRILYDVQMKLGMYDEAYSSAVLSLECVDTWEKRKRICEQMKEACAKAGAKAIKTQLVELQISIIDICIQHDVEPTRFRSILASKANAMYVGTLLMKLGEAEKFMAMIHFNLFSMEEGCHKLLDTVMEEGSGALQRVFIAMQKCSAQTYEVLVMCLFSAMRERVADVESLRSFIENCVRNDMKGRVYLTCEFLNEAFLTAQKTKDMDLMSLIKDAAEDKGNAELVAKTSKYV